MKKKTYKTSSDSSLADFIESIESEIFDEQIWHKEKMRKIAEVTYSYIPIKKENTTNQLNFTLFCEIGKLNIVAFMREKDEEKQKQMLLSASEVLTEKIETKKNAIERALQVLSEIKRTCSTLDQKIIEIIIQALEEKIYFFDYTLTGLPYEIEKAVGITVTHTEEIDEKLAILDQKLFGGEVHKNSDEVVLCYGELVHNYLKHFKKLSQKEQIQYESYLHKIELYLPDDYHFSQKTAPKNLIAPFSNYRLEDTKYIPGFNFFIESLQGLEHVALQNNEAGSISDGPSSIEFPTSKKFKSLDLARILKLNAHEIETHSITDHNHRQILGSIRGAKSIEKDEGLAMFMENILQFGNQLLSYDAENDKVIYDIHKFQLGQNLNYILMAELLDDADLKKFLALHAKLLGSKLDPEERFLRMKRSNKKRVQYKDSSYTRGLIKVVEEINAYIISEGKKGIKPEHLFLGKISFEETKKLYEIKKEKIKSGEKIHTLTPLFTSDAVIYSIDCKSKGIPVYEDGFLRYLEEKYPFFSFREKKIKLISHNIKRNVTSIVNIFWDKMGGENHNEKFILMLQNSTRKLSKKRRAVVESYIGSETT